MRSSACLRDSQCRSAAPADCTCMVSPSFLAHLHRAASPCCLLLLAGRMKGYHFQPSKEDIMIVSPAKCGLLCHHPHPPPSTFALRSAASKLAHTSVSAAGPTPRCPAAGAVPRGCVRSFSRCAPGAAWNLRRSTWSSPAWKWRTTAGMQTCRRRRCAHKPCARAPTCLQLRAGKPPSTVPNAAPDTRHPLHLTALGAALLQNALQLRPDAQGGRQIPVHLPR